MEPVRARSCRACGSSPAAIQYSFPSKRDLLQTALLHCADRAFTRQSLELDAIADAREALVRLVDRLLPLPGQVLDEWLIWLQTSNESSLRPDLRGVHNDFHRTWLELVARVVRRGQAHGVFRATDPRRFALGFVSLADGLASSCSPRRRTTPRTRCAACCSTMPRAS